MFISNAANISLIWSCFGNFLGYLRCCSSSNAILPYGRVLLDDGGRNLPLFFCRESLQHQQKDGYLSCYVMGLASIWIIAFLCPVSLAVSCRSSKLLIIFPLQVFLQSWLWYLWVSLQEKMESRALSTMNSKWTVSI